MDRALPEYNTILHKKWINENRRIHKRKVLGSTKLIDNELPASMKYPLVKTKKELLIEGKFLNLIKFS